MPYNIFLKKLLCQWIFGIADEVEFHGKLIPAWSKIAKRLFHP